MLTELTSQSPPLLQKTVHQIFLKDSRKMREIKNGTVHLVVTSPPYWTIKDYGNPKQIGYNDSLPDYFHELGKVWAECVRVLADGCRLCINIGDQYIRATESTPYQIIPLHAMMVNNLMTKHRQEIIYLGSIIWKKIPKTKTSGGASVMGSFGYPRNGYVSYNYEYIAIFKKKGYAPKPSKETKLKSFINLTDWRELFNGIWSFKGANQQGHVAVFPDELPKRLMTMFTYAGDTVLDPFLGSGTTTKVALELGRNSIGYEIGFKSPFINDTKEAIKKKIHFYDIPTEERAKFFPNLT
jgi:site-specific DNA-methyltransferase (adenine-specific)